MFTSVILLLFSKSKNSSVQVELFADRRHRGIKIAVALLKQVCEERLICNKGEKIHSGLQVLWRTHFYRPCPFRGSSLWTDKWIGSVRKYDVALCCSHGSKKKPVLLLNLTLEEHSTALWMSAGLIYHVLTCLVFSSKHSYPHIQPIHHIGDGCTCRLNLSDSRPT